MVSNNKSYSYLFTKADDFMLCIARRLHGESEYRNPVSNYWNLISRNHFHQYCIFDLYGTGE